MTVPSPSIVESKTEKKRNWQPRIVVFLCKQCSYTGADLTDSGRLSHDSLIEIIRVPCSGRVAPIFLLKCFEKGADGVLIFGCTPGNCRYSPGNYHAQRNLATFRTLLEFCGFDARRIHFSWTSTASGAARQDKAQQGKEPMSEFKPMSEFNITEGAAPSIEKPFFPPPLSPSPSLPLSPSPTPPLSPSPSPPSPPPPLPHSPPLPLPPSPTFPPTGNTGLTCLTTQ